jgi:hypothetical protein
MHSDRLSFTSFCPLPLASQPTAGRAGPALNLNSANAMITKDRMFSLDAKLAWIPWQFGFRRDHAAYRTL